MNNIASLDHLCCMPSSFILIFTFDIKIIFFNFTNLLSHHLIAETSPNSHYMKETKECKWGKMGTRDAWLTSDWNILKGEARSSCLEQSLPVLLRHPAGRGPNPSHLHLCFENQFMSMTCPHLWTKLSHTWQDQPFRAWTASVNMTLDQSLGN